MDPPKKKNKEKMPEKTKHHRSDHKDVRTKQQAPVDPEPPKMPKPRSQATDAQHDSGGSDKTHRRHANTSNSQIMPATKKKSHDSDPSGSSKTSPPPPPPPPPPVSSPDTDSGHERHRRHNPPNPNTQDLPHRGRDTNHIQSASDSGNIPPISSTPASHGRTRDPSGPPSSVRVPSRGPAVRAPSRSREKPTGSKDAATETVTKASKQPVPKSFPHNSLYIKTLPEKYIPRDKGRSQPTRTIVFGDIHGMIDAYNSLLNLIDYNSRYDHLILGGDLITKGRKSVPSQNNMTPDKVAIEASKDILYHAMKHNASGVRGNHEDWVLNVEHVRNHWKENVDDRKLDDRFPKKKLRTPDPKCKQDSKPEEFEDGNLYDALSHDEKVWLKKLPDILILGKCGGRENMVVVHAGFNSYLFDKHASNTKLALENQRVIETMNIKTLDPKTGYTSSMHDGDKEVNKMDEAHQKLFRRTMMPWFEAWDSLQQSLEPEKQITAIYGHESKKGLTVSKFSIGLDTGVQRIDSPKKYRTLTALVIYEEYSEIVQVHEMVAGSGKWEAVDSTWKSRF